MAKKTYNIYIFGAGKYAQYVLPCIKKEIYIEGYLDNDINKQSTEIGGVAVFSIADIIDRKFDYIIISALRKFNTILHQLNNMGIDRHKIISFYDYRSLVFDEYNHIFNISLWKQTTMEQVFMEDMKLIENYVSNMEYEIADKISQGYYKFPIIESGIEALRLIEKEKYSMCRLGDGEFDIIAGKERAKFQNSDGNLGIRLKEVLANNEKNVITCIADNYASLEQYEESAARSIRGYMTREVRKEHMSVINLRKTYYDAYVSRPYIIYKDKVESKEKFEMWKKIWQEREVVIIEGELARIGYANDLFQNAKSIGRILCPQKNSWSFYEIILQTIIEQVSKDKLILISLGPAATVLAYDLARAGHQAIDIGQLDNEYEWFLRKAQWHITIPDKFVSESYGGDIVGDIESDWYESQIMTRIG